MLWLLLTTLLAAGPDANTVPLNTGFVVIDGVYNSELIAPFDILEHSRYRDRKHFFKCFLISPDGKPIKTAEGLRIESDFSFENAPELDVLIIASTVTSMDKDLVDGPYMNYLRKAVDQAKVVITLCDGAFPLAKTGVLDNLKATTFPGDQDRFEEMFPKIDVQRNTWFVHQGKYITSVGGARSYEPALFLAHQWFDEAYAKRLARGLVIDWDLTKIPHQTHGPFPKRPK